MGPKANDVFQSFRLSEEDGKKYKTVKDKFDDYLTFRWNTLYMNVWNLIGDHKEQKISRQTITDL